MTKEERQKDHELKGQLALQALRRAVRNAFLDGSAYDPDGTGKIYWETHDESGNPIETRKSA
jgi:hypothetical protein